MTALNSLEWLKSYCSSQLLIEKWLVCEDLRTSQTWKDRIALAGTPTVNLHGHSLRNALLSLVNPWIAETNLTFLNPDIAHGLVLQLFLVRSQAEELRYFRNDQYAANVAGLLARTIRDLRMAELSPQELRVEPFHAPDKCSDLRLLYQDYIQALGERKLVDYAACLHHAIAEIVSGRCGLPTGLIVLIPNSWPMSPLESKFLQALGAAANVHRRDDHQPFAPEKICQRLSHAVHAHSLSVDTMAGYGEVNEVRAVMQRILRDNERLDDVEVVHTDSATYVPLIYEFIASLLANFSYNKLATASSDDVADNALAFYAEELPVTFAEGIACVYTRPGRALRAWLRWADADFVQSKLVQMLREGLIARPDSAQSIGYARLASNLRRIPIGFRLERYLSALERAIAEAQVRQAEDRQVKQEPSDDVPRDYGLPVLQALREMLQPLIELAPQRRELESSHTLLHNAKKFLLSSARCDHKLDRLARNKLLDEIDGRLASLEFAHQEPVSVLQWLEELAVESKILESGPRPGSIHVSRIERGGTSGRRRIFVLGMDAGRYPLRRPVDPCLLDDERSELSSGLKTSVQLTEEQQSTFLRMIERVLEVPKAKISFSFATRDLIEDRDLTPSTSLVDLFRLTNGQPEAHQNDLMRHVGPPIAFVSSATDDWLAASDRMLAGLLMMDDAVAAHRWVELCYPHMAKQRVAAEQRLSDDFTAFDGLVREAGRVLNPAHDAGEVSISSSRLEMLGKCPRQFFFKNGLQIRPPEDYEVDHERWLDALQMGSLLHGVFESFLKALHADDRIPNVQRDNAVLMKHLDERVQLLRSKLPEPSLDAYLRDYDRLKETCEIFLQAEQEYCEALQARPWVLEGAIGMEGSGSAVDSATPVSLTLTDGRVLRVVGKIDRIDRYQQNGAESYAIWDYKTGSSYGYSQEDPFRQGRKLQPYLYVSLLRHRLPAVGGDRDASISFGYVFPSAKEVGMRMTWSKGELRGGDEILRLLCDLVTAGAFPATTNKDDCTFCDYREVCGDVVMVAAESTRKTTLPILRPWKELRDL